MLIMIDTNIIISAILYPQSIISKILKHIVSYNKLVLSQYTIDEIHKVFKKKFPHKINEMEIFLGKLPYELFILTEINATKFPNIRDIDDIPILANAIESKADILITGDKDFDGIVIKKPKILKPRIYFEKYVETQNSV